MTYIERSLGEGEKLIRRARFHWFHYLRAWVVFTLFLGSGMALLITYGVWWPFLSLAAVGFLFYVRLMYAIWTTEIGVTNQRLIFKRGLLARRTDELMLWAVEGVNLKQGISGRIFGYGRVEVQGTGDDRLFTPAITEPQVFRKVLQDAINQARPPGTATARELAGAGATRKAH